MKREFIYLFLGLLSSICLFKLIPNNIGELKELNMFFNFSFFDLAVESSDELYLTTDILAYIFYLFFIFLFYKKYNELNIRVCFFILINIIGIFFEFFRITLFFNNNFSGQHFRVGILIFLLGVTVLTSNQKTLNRT